MKLGDTVFYTTPGGTVQVAIIIRIHSDGLLDLVSFCPLEHRVGWPKDVKVTGAAPGSEEAFGKWCSR